jgi:hypothetical protein
MHRGPQSLTALLQCSGVDLLNMASASSTAMPRYLTVLSTWPPSPAPARQVDSDLPADGSFRLHGLLDSSRKSEFAFV